MGIREITFRGKRKSDGQWVEGDLSRCVAVGETHICRVEDNLSTTTHRVDPETVCQYTGLADKNGRKIFEGDILSGRKYHGYGQGGEYKPDMCIVKWNKERAAFDPVYWWEGYKHDLKDYEVVGNVFDNPKLLEGGGAN